MQKCTTYAPCFSRGLSHSSKTFTALLMLEGGDERRGSMTAGACGDVKLQLSVCFQCLVYCFMQYSLDEAHQEPTLIEAVL